jgi:hypothetical protein
MLKMALDAALAIIPLESNKIVHRDIACRNFLGIYLFICLLFTFHFSLSFKVDAALNVKLNDFGLARKLESNEYTQKSTETKLPIRWY